MRFLIGLLAGFVVGVLCQGAHVRLMRQAARDAEQPGGSVDW